MSRPDLVGAGRLHLDRDVVERFAQICDTVDERAKCEEAREVTVLRVNLVPPQTGRRLDCAFGEPIVALEPPAVDELLAHILELVGAQRL